MKPIFFLLYSPKNNSDFCIDTTKHGSLYPENEKTSVFDITQVFTLISLRSHTVHIYQIIKGTMQANLKQKKDSQR